MTRSEVVSRIHALLDQHEDLVVSKTADQITADDDCTDILAQSAQLHAELAHNRVDVIARVTAILDEIPMTKSETYLERFTTELVDGWASRAIRSWRT